MNRVRTYYRENRAIFQTIFFLSWPAVVEQALQTLVQYIDTAMVGRLGAQASASVGLTSTMTWLVNAPLFAMGIMALVLRLPKIREPHVLRVLAFISRHSYGIILIHWWVIFWPVKRHFGLGTAPLSGTVCLFITAVTFLISLLGAFGIDRLIIYPTERFLESVRKSLHKLHIKA